MNPSHHIRAKRLADLRERLKDDDATRPAWNALQAIDAATSDLAARRESLSSTGLLTPAGVHSTLKEHRQQHAAALRKAKEAVRANAEKLLAATKGAVELPADHARLLTYWQTLPRGERDAALARAMAGRDPELAAVIAHSSNERFVRLAPSTLEVLRSRFADADAVAANEPRLHAHHIANEALDEALHTIGEE